MVTWPDRFHHPREDLIYARVAEVDETTADEVDTLQRDHDDTAKNGQRMLRDIERWRRGEITGPALIKAGRGYVEHIYEHMNVEEKVVFPHIEATLSLQDWRELADDDRLAEAGRCAHQGCGQVEAPVECFEETRADNGVAGRSRSMQERGANRQARRRRICLPLARR